MTMEDRSILHCDMNSFFCSVELLDHPELRDKPVAVAGDRQSRHGIILAKNQIAKSYGVATPEPVIQALRKCPDLVLLEAHYDKYSHYSSLINEIYLEYTDLVEPFSIDESWLDVTGSIEMYKRKLADHADPSGKGQFNTMEGNGPYSEKLLIGKMMADEIRTRIRELYGLTLSVGVSFNKTFAKMGSEYKKPDATTVISRDNYKKLLWPLPAGEFFFIGKSTADKLSSVGIKTVGDVAQTAPAVLEKLLGQHGGALYRAVNGLEDSPVRRWGDRDPAKSVGHGITFPRDLRGWDEVAPAVTKIADKVATRLRRYNMKSYGVKVEITSPDFTKRSKQHKLSSPYNTSDVIKREARRIIQEMGFLNKPIRLLTITAIDLAAEDAGEQLTIFSIDEINNGAQDPPSTIENIISAAPHGSSDSSTSDDTSTPSPSQVQHPAPASSSRNTDLERSLDEIRKRFGKESIGFAGSSDNLKD